MEKKCEVLGLILMLVFFASCQLSNVEFIETFEEKGSVEFLPFSNQPAVLGKTTNMILVGEWLVISKYKGEYVLCLYDTREQSFYFVAKRGKGPGDLSHGTFLNRLTDSTFVVLNPEFKKLSYYSISGGSLLFDSAIVVRSPVRNICMINSSSFISSGGGSFNKKYGKYTHGHDSISEFIEYPIGLNDDMNGFQQSIVYNSNVYRRPEHDNQLVSIYANHVILDFIKLEKEELVITKRQEQEHFEWSAGRRGRPLPASESIPVRVFSQRNYITEESIFVYYEFTDKSTKEAKYWILEFDWAGNRIGKYKSQFRLKSINHYGESVYAVAMKDDTYQIGQIIIK